MSNSRFALLSLIIGTTVIVENTSCIYFEVCMHVDVSKFVCTI